MMKRRLTEYFSTSQQTEEGERAVPPERSGSKEEAHPVSKSITPKNLPTSHLVSATYDGERGLACLKLYEPRSARIYLWYDTTGHMPYCLTNLSTPELKKIDRLTSHPRFDHFETIEKYDPLQDRQVTLTKVVGKDPLAIGGRGKAHIRDIIPEEYPKIGGIEKEVRVWEAAIKYYQCYIYDREMAPGMTYRIHDGQLAQVEHPPSESIVEEIGGLFEDQELSENVEMWARLLEYPAPSFRRVALDIEVFSPISTRVPDPTKAEHPVICATLLGTDGRKRVLLLKRKNMKEGIGKLPSDVEVEYYPTEQQLISQIFRALQDYPFIITFNGDDFDLRYLWHRARNLGLGREQNPIQVGRRVCLLNRNIHLDLYKFFYNRSIQIYAFNQKYRDVTLDSVGKALLGMEKLELDKPISQLSYLELAHYCFRDAQITLQLTRFDDDLVMKLILALARISRMPLEDVSRLGVSRWIRNFLHYEHRRRNILIPDKEDILIAKGKTTTKAIIKGKKYKGAIVVDPVPGVHFNVKVMDFASLYPSIIKVHNLGYQTIRCPHSQCEEDKVPDTPHWVCTKQRALESLLIGSMRDLRVRWYKPKSKNEELPNQLRSWYNVIQSALKVILNASYGVFGAETFDLYCPPVAEATASLGRHVITQTINKAQELGIQVIYGDTDSVFLKDPTTEQIETLASWSEEELGMELEVDKVYRYSIFSSRKKNYLGVLPDGNIDVKGLTGKKRHIPTFIKKAFDKMEDRLSQVKTPAEFEEAKKEIREIVRDRYLQLKQREWGDQPEELAFHVVLGKDPKYYVKTTPQHVKAARILQKEGYEIKAGDLISFVKVAQEPHVKPVQLASNSEIDVTKYVGYLQSTFDQVLDALGLDFEEIIGLTKLERFM